MFKNLIRILIAIIIIIIFFVLYLSIFGIKTSKFNEIIKSQANKQDNRLNIDLKNVFIKLNIKERSFSLNSKDVKFLILKQSQEIDNVDLLISLGSIIGQDNILELAKTIVNKKLNVRQVESLARSKRLKRNGRSILKDPNISFLEKELEDILGLKINILDKKGKGKITFNYKSLDQLDEIINKLKDN